MTATFNKRDIFVQNIGLKTESLGAAADVIKMMLTDSAPVATNRSRQTFTQDCQRKRVHHRRQRLTVTSWTQPSGTLKWIVRSPTLWTFITAPMGPLPLCGSLQLSRRET